MKRISFLFGVILFVFIVLSQPGAEASRTSFTDRFAGDTKKMGDSGTYNFDRAHTVIGFKAGHNGLIEVPGFFRDFTGAITFDNKDISKSSVEFTAKVTSVDTGIAGRDNHLRTPDFFEVAKFPEMIFKSTKVAKKGKGWLVTGDLTIKDVTKSITFPFNISGFLPANDRNGGRMGVTAETVINRRDFNVNYDAKIGGTTLQVVSDEIKVWLQIEAVKPKDASPKPAE